MCSSDLVNALEFIILGTKAKTIEEGETLYLNESKVGNAWAGGQFVLDITDYKSSETDQNNTGELVITKFDLEENIVSGTFWFDMENPYTGEIVEIREGRFDTYFTQ